MGKRGPQPEPAAIKLLSGTYRRDRHGDAADAPSGMPEKPDWLDEQEALVWDHVVELLGKWAGLLAPVDGMALARYCSDWVEFHACRETLEREGLVAFSEKGAVYQHPLVGIRNKAMERMSKFEARFHMTPADRIGAKVDTPKAEGVRRRQG